MNFRLELICVKGDGTVERREVLTIAKEQLAMETLGLTVAQGKARCPYGTKLYSDEQRA